MNFHTFTAPVVAATLLMAGAAAEAKPHNHDRNLRNIQREVLLSPNFSTTHARLYHSLQDLREAMPSDAELAAMSKEQRAKAYQLRAEQGRMACSNLLQQTPQADRLNVMMSRCK